MKPTPWETEQLAAELAELLKSKPSDAPFLDVLADARFHRFEVGVALARRAAALQGVDAGRCAQLAAAANALCAWPSAGPGGAVEAGERVRALVGNAVRLRGNGDGHLALGLMTWHRQLPRAHGGELLRAQGLVHWEQSQLTEAVALLAVANVRFSDQRRAGEVLATRELRVLLHAEMGESWEALRLYATCRNAKPPAERPWLSARAALTAAFCWAERGSAGDRAELRQALRRGGELAAKVTAERECLTLAWLTARAEARETSDARRAEALEALREPALHLLG